MKKGLIIFLFLSIAVTCFSQDSYPKLTLLPSGDTGVILLKRQMDAIYLFSLNCEKNSLLMKDMQLVLDGCNNAVPIVQEREDELKRISSLKDKQLLKRDNDIIDFQKVLNHRESQIIRLKWSRFGVGVAGFITTSFITYLYFNKK